VREFQNVWNKFLCTSLFTSLLVLFKDIRHVSNVSFSQYTRLQTFPPVNNAVLGERKVFFTGSSAAGCCVCASDEQTVLQTPFAILLLRVGLQLRRVSQSG
jgi:hypothetical protein